MVGKSLSWSVPHLLLIHRICLWLLVRLLSTQVLTHSWSHHLCEKLLMGSFSSCDLSDEGFLYLNYVYFWLWMQVLPWLNTSEIWVTMSVWWLTLHHVGQRPFVKFLDDLYVSFIPCHMWCIIPVVMLQIVPILHHKVLGISLGRFVKWSEQNCIVSFLHTILLGVAGWDACW